MEEEKSNQIRVKPGSGNIWNNKPRKWNYNYDYTKHQISRGNKGYNFSNKVK